MRKNLFYFIPSIYFFCFIILETGNLFAQKVFTFEDIMTNPLYNEKPDFSKKNPSTMTFNADSVILPYLFSYPMIPNQLDTPVTTLDALGQRLQKFDISTSDLFTSYASMSIVNDTLIDTIFRVDFQLNSKMYESYSYFVPGLVSADSVAFMIIPGSGYNQSTQIYNNNLADYHGDIAARVSKYGDTYIFTKPIYDFLGIHWNGKLLTHEAFTAHLINNGYSWGAYYLTQAIALSKHLKNKYKKFIILGLSQGGWATTYVSLQVEPTAAVAASGYTIRILTVAWMGINQMIGHNIFTNYTNPFIYNTIQAQSTKYLFTYGKSDNGGYFKSEAENLYTCNYFSSLPNVSCGIGNWAHQFGDTLTTEPFIEDVIRPVPMLNIASDTAILCAGDTLLLATANAPGYLFQWYKDSLPISGAANDSLIVTAGGAYKVWVSTTSNVFAYSSPIIILMDTTQVTLSVFTSTSSDSICPGDSALLVSSYYNYSTIDWLRNDTLILNASGKDSIYVKLDGAYKIFITTPDGCQKYSDPSTIFYKDTIRPLININGTVLSVGTLYQSYQWYYQGMQISGANQNTYTAGSNGDYFVLATMYNGCTVISDTVLFSLTNNPDYSFESFTLSEFHEGALQILMDNNEKGNVEITIYNANGSLVKKTSHHKNSTSFCVRVPVSTISAGIYVVNIRLNNYSYNKKAVNYTE